MSDYDGSQGIINMLLEHYVRWDNIGCCATGPQNPTTPGACRCDDDEENFVALITEYGDRRVQEAAK